MSFQGGYNVALKETLHSMFKWLCPPFSSLPGVHHTYIQGKNVRLLHYMCLASATVEFPIYNLQNYLPHPLGLHCGSPRGHFSICVLSWDGKGKKYKSHPRSHPSFSSPPSNAVGEILLGTYLKMRHLNGFIASLSDSFPNWQCFTETHHLSKPARKRYLGGGTRPVVYQSIPWITMYCDF